MLVFGLLSVVAPGWRVSYTRPGLALRAVSWANPLLGWSVEYFQPSTSPEPVQPAFPVRLRIPAIGVDATIEYVGLTPSGAMDVPADQNDVAWFKPGNIPGDIGTAVIAGHYGWNRGKPSAFDALYKLRPGDQIFVDDDQGATDTFVVRENRRFDPKADASSVFSSDDGTSHLNLITCEGSWNTAANGYTKRLVVFADKQ